jgi:hypothetical protein
MNCGGTLWSCDMAWLHLLPPAAAMSRCSLSHTTLSQLCFTNTALLLLHYHQYHTTHFHCHIRHCHITYLTPYHTAHLSSQSPVTHLTPYHTAHLSSQSPVTHLTPYHTAHLSSQSPVTHLTPYHTAYLLHGYLPIKILNLAQTNVYMTVTLTLRHVLNTASVSGQRSPAFRAVSSRLDITQLLRRLN